MIRDALDGDAQQEAQAAVADFEDRVPDAKNARDVLDHFDAYAQGIGNLSHPGVKPSQRMPTEAAARQFDVFYEAGGPDHYVVHLGSLSVDIKSARAAADALVDRILNVLGLAASTEDQMAVEMDPDNPLHIALAFLTGLWSSLSPDVVDALAQLVTPEVRDDWGDFSEAARTTEGYAPTSLPARPSQDVAYVKLVPDTGQVRQATQPVTIVDAWWLTLQRRSDLTPQWRVYALARFPIEHDEMPWPSP
jgi:hypothetical protein